MAEPPDDGEPPEIRTAAARLSPRTQQALRIGIVAATLISAAAAILIAAGRGPTRPGDSFEAPRIQVATPSGQVTRLAYLRRGRLMLTVFNGGLGRMLLRVPPGRLACPRAEMLAISPAGDAVALIGPDGATVVNAARLVTSYGWRPKRAARCQVRWSPDGRVIAFEAGRDALVVRRAGGRIAELHRTNGFAFTEAGGALLFAGQPVGLNPGIQSLDLATGRVRTLVTARAASDPLPNEATVAYTVTTGGEPAVWLWPGAGAPHLVSGRHHAAAWLSDGETLLADHPTIGRGGLRIVRLSPGGIVTGVARGALIGVSRVGEVALIGLPTARGLRLFAQDLRTGLRQQLPLPTVAAASWTG